MKKILFASTALLATAGVAAADTANVNINGLGRFGLEYNENRAAGETFLHQRLDMNFDVSTEADNGLTFGARIRMRASTDGRNFTPAVAGPPAVAAVPNSNTIGTFNAARFFVTAGGLTTAVGNILGAVDSTPGLYAGSVGLTGISFSNTPNTVWGDQLAYSGGGAGAASGVEVIYDGGPFGAHIAHGNEGTAIGGGEATQLMVSYSTGDYTFAAAYQNSDANGDLEWLLTAGATIGPVDVTGKIASNDNDDLSFGVAGSFDVGAATTVSAYVQHYENILANGDDNTSYGIGFVHDLGGGASIRGGVAETAADTLQADLGVRFNF